MTTTVCDICKNAIPAKVDLFVLTLAARSNLLDKELFTLDLCAQCATKLKPDADHFTETIATANKARNATGSRKSA